MKLDHCRQIWIWFRTVILRLLRRIRRRFRRKWRIWSSRLMWRLNILVRCTLKIGVLWTKSIIYGNTRIIMIESLIMYEAISWSKPNGPISIINKYKGCKMRRRNNGIGLLRYGVKVCKIIKCWSLSTIKQWWVLLRQILNLISMSRWMNCSSCRHMLFFRINKLMIIQMGIRF